MPETSLHRMTGGTPSGEDDLSTLEQLREIVRHEAVSLPNPGRGATRQRFAALARWAGRDLSLGRLAEGHVDALAILDEAGAKPEAGRTYGVWAARPPENGTRARLKTDGWHLSGMKPFCSGSTHLERALVTAQATDGYRLFEISVADHVVAVHPGTWPAIGMARSMSDTLEFGGPPVEPRHTVGLPEFYVERPGFWFGAVGVAACWFGGARALVAHVATTVGPHPSDVVAAEVGRAVAHVEAMHRVLEHAADEIDADPVDAQRGAQRRAIVVRHAVHHAANRVLDHVAAAGGARPLCHDEEQARRAADLYVYLSQFHGPQDARFLGLAACEETSWP
jgi:alkylation response protein AidB-like acyl-CoA dehydrogenase